jgi:hypothetical protein
MALAAPVTMQGTWYGTNGWDGTLRGRDAAGNPVNLLDASATAPNPSLRFVYDVVLDLTWLADWNAPRGSVYDDGGSPADGGFTFAGAVAWVESLTYFGGGWTLPSVLDLGDDGCNPPGTTPDCGYAVYDSEVERRGAHLAHLYYDTLGNLPYRDRNGNIVVGGGSLILAHSRKSPLTRSSFPRHGMGPRTLPVPLCLGT